MAQLVLESKDIKRIETKVGRKDLVRVSHFHPSIKVERIGTIIDDTFAVIEFINSPCVVYYTIREASKVLSKKL